MDETMDFGKPGYRVLTWSGHPLAGKTGLVFEHRAVLFNSIGVGPHNCHYCGKELVWKVRGQRISFEFNELCVDHLDGDKLNNNIENLVPACHGCNLEHGFNPRLIREGELTLTRPNGKLLRAEERNCFLPSCGKSFLIEPSSPKVYCSRDCMSISKRLDERIYCKHGHALVSENLNNSGRCRTCAIIANQKLDAKRKEARRLTKELNQGK